MENIFSSAKQENLLKECYKMLDIKYIRENADEVRKAIQDKQLTGTINLDELLETDKSYREVLHHVEVKRALKNQLSDDISKVKEKEVRDKLIAEATTVKEELGALEEELNVVKQRMDELLLWVPNIPAPDVPIGENEEGNKVVRQVGEIKDFSFQPKDHMELGTSLDVIDVDRGVKLGGFRSYFLKNKGVLLQHALMRYALDLIKSKGFDIYEVPWLVRPEFFKGTGYFPWGVEDHYKTQDDLALIGTAEVSLTSLYADEILHEDDLPVKVAAMSPCYRREVGSHGKDTKGILRVHQFMKVEQVVLVPEGEQLSIEWHEKMLGYAEEMLKNLGLPYQVLLMCTGDMGAGQRKKYDIETWLPAENRYIETHSDSYFLDFQARRLNMRYKTKEGEIKFVNTLNNTVAASTRLIAAVLENYQNEDGSVTIPEVLKEYLDFSVIMPDN